MDLARGFFQIELEPNSRPCSAFSSPLGEFQFRWISRVAYRLKEAPNTFSRMMALAFADIIPSKAFLYIDDICAHGSSGETHIKNLLSVFQICRKRRLKINPNKCQFFREEVIYLGHKLTRNGILPDPAKFKAIREYPIPQNADRIKRFVAFANYYRKFVRNFSTLTACLNELTKKNSIFIWTAECQNAFDVIREKLMSPQILVYPDFKNEFTGTRTHRSWDAEPFCSLGYKAFKTLSIWKTFCGQNRS